MNQRAQELIRSYALEQHPEGGWFSEVYTSEGSTEEREYAGSIYFLLAENEISHFHQIDCEELWFFHEGCGLVLHIIDLNGNYRKKTLGNDCSKGEAPMIAVKKGEIFAAENLRADGYTFISCVTAPKFRYSGFRLVPKEEVQRADLPEKLFLAYG